MSRSLIASFVVVVSLAPGLAGADALTAMIQEDLVALGYAVPSSDGEMTVETAVAISQFQAERGMDVTGEVSPQLAGVLKAAISKPDMPAPVIQEAPAVPAAQAVQAQPAPAQQGSGFGAIAGAMAPSMMQGMLSGAAGVDPATMQMLTGGQPQQAEMDPETMAALQAQMAQMMGGATGVDPAMIQAVQMEAMQEQAQQECLQQMVAQAQVEQQQSQKSSGGFGGLMRAVKRLGGDELLARVAEAQADIAEANATIADLEAAAADLGLTHDDVAACGVAQ